MVTYTHVSSDPWTVSLVQSEDYLTVRLESAFAANEFLAFLLSKKKRHNDAPIHQ